MVVASQDVCLMCMALSQTLSQAQPVLSQLRQVVGEVERLVSRTVTTTPALAPLADPVTIQLVSGIISVITAD